MIPSHYTDVEGEEWKIWTEGVVFHELLSIAQRAAKAVDSSFAIINGVKVHSLLIAVNPLDKSTFSLCREWDVVNGWRKPREIDTRKVCPVCGVREGENCQSWNEKENACNYKLSLRKNVPDKD